MAAILASKAEVCRRCGEPLAGAELSGNCPRCLATLLLSPETPEPADTSPTPILRRLGDYELLEEVARGGMGVVFRARQVSLEREVAVKVLRDAWLATPVQVKRFRAEAANAAKLKHPNIVAVHEVGEQGGQHFFAMDLIKGSNLAELTRDGPLPSRRAAELVKKVAEAVQHAHQEGVLHRDIKPSNVLLDAQGEPQVTDFGLARPMDDESSLTLTGQVLGTPGYMSPEQAKGGSTVGPAADIYGLGALLFHLLTGRAPFVGASAAETLTQVLQQEPLSPRLLNPTVPIDLAAVCLKCLGKLPRERYGSAGELAADLERHLRNETTHARPTGPVERSVRWCRRKPALAAAVAALLIVGLVGLAGILWEWRRAEAESLKFQFRSYVADMDLAWRALKENNLAEVTSLLEAQRPGAGDRDLRGWEWRYLWQACQGEQLWTLGPMQDEVLGLALLPGGRLVTGITCGGVTTSNYSGGEVRIWDLERRQVVRRASLAPFNLSGLAVSPDGQHMAVATWERKILLLNATTLETLGELPHEKPVWDVDFSPDGKLLSAHGTEDLSIWEISTHKRLWATNTPRGFCGGVPFSPDGKWVCCQLADGSISLLRTTDGGVIRRTEFSAPLSSPIVTSRDGRWLAAGDWDGEVVLTDATLTRTTVLTNHHAAVRAIAFSPDSRQLASAGADRLVKLWDVETGKEIATFSGHRRAVRSLVYSTDGRRLFTGASDGSVRAWLTEPKEQAVSWPTPTGFYNSALSRDGRFLVAFETNGLLHLFSLETKHEITTVKMNRPSGYLATGPDGREIAMGLSDGTVEVWDLAEGRVRWRFLAHSNQVDALAFSPDRKLLATAGRGAEIRVWQRGSSRLLVDRVVGDIGSHVSELVFAADSATLVVPAYGKIHLLSLRPGVPDRQIEMGEAFSVDISRDGSLVAAGMEEAVNVWEVSSLRRVASLRGSLGGFNCVNFSPDGHRLIGSDAAGVTWLWDLDTSRAVGRFGPKLGRGILQARFQPTGNTIAIVRYDNGLDGLELLRAPSWAVIESTEKLDPKVQ